jgi:uncharacterized protein (TIGR03083 family)
MARGSSRTPAVLLAQADLISDWVDGLSEEDHGRPSVLPGWRVADLVAHVAFMLRRIVDVAGVPTGKRPLSVAGYVGGYPPAANAILDREIAAARNRTGRELAAILSDGRDGVRRLLESRPDGATEGRVGPPDPTATVVGGPGPIRWDDYLVTRVIELVVHGDDLARSLPDREPLTLDRQALRVAAVALARVLAERAPGHSVELRVPPYVAIQCVEGPRHTRGTPPNVVETDPLTWVRLAAGRLGWADAVAGPSVRASGPRADLAPWLPLL